jgi:membrane associated rhomboid family serine protease
MRQGGSLFARRPITKGALYLLVITSAASLLFLLAGQGQAVLAEWLVATTDGIWRQGKFWQIVTGPLIEPQFIGLVFQALMLWIFLPALESWWGTKKFLQFAVITSISAVIVGSLAGLLLGQNAAITGLSAFIFAGIVAYGVLFSDHKVHFFGVVPMTGKQLTIGIVAFMAVFIVIGQQWAVGAGNAAAMLIAWGMVSGKLAPQLWYLKLKQRWLRRKLKVVRDRDDDRWLN